jgi:hypothetical protein
LCRGEASIRTVTALWRERDISEAVCSGTSRRSQMRAKNDIGMKLPEPVPSHSPAEIYGTQQEGVLAGFLKLAYT